MTKSISFYSKMLLFACIFFINLNLHSKEVYKSKAAGGGANEFKQYSMCRSNPNTGFVYSGTTKGPNGNDCIHIIKTNNTFTTTWSYYYEESANIDLNSTKITKKYDGTGYWISGYYGTTTGRYPYLMEIDENGTVLSNQVADWKGAFLDVEATSDNGCIAVGFISSVLEEYVTIGSGARRAIISKFTSTSTISWTNVFHGNIIGDYEIAENVTVINNVNTSYQDYYFITGSITEAGVPYLAYLYIDNSGSPLGSFYRKTCAINGNAFDVTYDAAEHKIYFVGKWDIFSVDQAMVVGRIDVATGNIDYQKSIEGLYTNYPFPHSPWAYKIELDGDHLLLFGYVRAYSTSITTSTNLVIPFHATLNKSNASQVSFIINHSDINRTAGYPSVDPGFLNAWDNNPSIFSDNFPSVYAPEMAVKYLDANNNTQWAMIGYYDQPGAPLTYDLHFINSENSGECDPLERDLFIENLFVEDHEIYYVNFTLLGAEKTINQYSLNFYSNSCN